MMRRNWRNKNKGLNHSELAVYPISDIIIFEQYEKNINSWLS